MNDRHRDKPSWATYLEANMPRLGRLRDAVLDAADLRPGYTVLDVGAGTGLLTFGAVPRVHPGGLVIALDVDPGCLDALGREAAGRDLLGRVVRVVQGSAEALPLPGSSVDAVVARSVLVYVPDRSRAIREMLRVLRSGRRASLFEPLPAGLREEADLDWRPVWAVRLAVERLRDEARRDPLFAAPLSLTADGLAEAFHAAGFADVMTETRDAGEVGRGSLEAHFRSLEPPRNPQPGTRSWLSRLRGEFAEADLRAYVDHTLSMADQGRYRIVLPTVYLRARKP